MKKTYLLLASALMLGFSACDTARQTQDPETQAPITNARADEGPTPVGAVMSKNGLRVFAFDDSQKYPESQLRLNTPPAGGVVEPGPVAFDYSLSNYQLTRMTPHSNAEHLANSQEGQHIHNIVDNQPYTAHYETEFTKDLEEGEHVILSFLSRSYHESLKHQGAYDLRKVTAGKPTQRLDINLKDPHMFYSRPKGEYVGADTEQVMLDFYLVNTELSAEGNRVRATINGTEFILDRWLPYIMEGLPMGENTIKLELIDRNGNVLPGPYNSVTRTFTLKPAA
ncbi:hypothetical protein [Pontibacter akesuensis]|uniref:Phosphopeptide-binding protein n=1 Tax=Pontibacter akesuensis TaxID=388950 RepID=A0A1I7HV04_9BACT|nr:hypothetical protein [Pontibacter akesuensis]GHA63693.1 hypothetical protein GCM10007389_15380 [Pontibacter akesuensis]SFU64568.1 hypothetical protein SAMN04487941_1697 [Pontibacter akesuensis]